jgi:hypothetical protein
MLTGKQGVELSMPTNDDLVADWKRIRADLAQQLELFESGKMGSGDRVLRSTSAQAIERIKRSIAELDGLLAEHAS